MLRTPRKNSTLYAIALSALFALSAVFPGLTLFSGQVIKQFETYSLASSLSKVGWNPLATQVPCDGGIRWVLELPIFVSMSSVFVALFPGWPALFPLLVFGFFFSALYRLRLRLDPEGSSLPWIALAAAPVFLRFSTQFLPDPFALALLIFGVCFFLEDRKRASWLLFLAAVSVKPTVLPSVLFFRWVFTVKRSLIREGVFALSLLAPFVAWTLLLKLLHIPSPLHEGGLLSIGSGWGILLDPKFYSKFLVWTVFKGVGIPLALIGLCGVLHARKSGEQDSLVLKLALWSSGIFPYWLLVRQLNFVHDYYSLSFFLPIALVGVISASKCLTTSPEKKTTVLAVQALLAISILQGVGVFVKTALDTPHQPVSQRPIFCGNEFRVQALMGLPKVE